MTAPRTPTQRRFAPSRFAAAFSAHIKATLPALLLLVASASGTQAYAQAALVGTDYRKVDALISANNHTAAAQAADSYLATNPRDPQMRILKSRILVAQSKKAEARTLLETLTQEYPEIAEPYNNLAVLYAEEGQIELARAALENALRINPNYATALHNLGDIYQRMARNSYSKALALQPNNAQLQNKVKLLK